MRRVLLLWAVCVMWPLTLSAESGGVAAADSAAIMALVDKQHSAGVKLATQIWEWAEVGYQEVRSSEALQNYLESQGFTLTNGVADIPTAFVAQYSNTSSGHAADQPVIGILAEFDALPGLSQVAQPQRQPRLADGAGHACGHHLFGAASVTAAAALRQWLQASGQQATIKVFGTPAEEGGSGKVYLARAGLFDDVDVMLHWHPGSANSASPSTTTANKSGRFTFRGKAAHAASAPHSGRSALDGVEAMNFMVNMMREHVPQTSRIHYVITDGGDAPNIVPEQAQVYYYVRHPRADMVVKLFEREVPEIYEGIVRIEGCAREPGHRAKVAVSSIDPDVDPVGACVGLKGSRVQAVVNEVRGEAIDIIQWHPDPARFVQYAIQPAAITRVYIDEPAKTMELIVPDDQLAKAIGRRGQNVRLASQLTGWRLDITAESKHDEQLDAARMELARIPGLDDDSIDELLRTGFVSAQEVADAEDGEIEGVLGVDTPRAQEIVEAADKVVEQLIMEEAERRRRGLTSTDGDAG